MKIKEICNQLSTCDLPWSGYKCAYFAAAAWEVFNKLGHELSICASTGGHDNEDDEWNPIFHLIHIVLQDKQGRLAIDPSDNFKIVINDADIAWWCDENMSSYSEDNQANSILRDWEDSWLEENKDIDGYLVDNQLFTAPGHTYWGIMGGYGSIKDNNYVKSLENLMLKHLGV